MFDELLRELKKLEAGTLVPVQIPVDDDGYFDRQCPAEQCRAFFKVLFSDWRDKVKDEQVFCPICRHESASTEWNTETQAEHIEATALAHLEETISRAMRVDTETFNRLQPRGGFISLRMSYRPRTTPVLVTPEAAEIMRRNHTCDECSCKFASIGAAFFCPSCGARSVIKTFEMEVAATRNTVQSLAALKESIVPIVGSDVAQDTCRTILENAQASLVGLFQHYAEELYLRVPNAPKARKNVFQNLAESSGLWKAAIGKGYEDLIGKSALDNLNRLFQQRHLIAHKGGVVDAEYVSKSGDMSYATGQRLVVTESSVLRLADLVGDLGKSLVDPSKGPR